MNEEDMTTVLTVTGDDALEALRHVVTEKGPDYIYRPPVKGQTSCVYVWEVDGKLQPQCIVGCALHHLGVPLDALAAGDVNNINVWALASKLGPRYVLETRAVDIFRAAQLVQDSALKTGCTCDLCAGKVTDDTSSTWGQALIAAQKWAAMYPVKKYTEPRTPGVPPTTTEPVSGPDEFPFSLSDN